MSDQQLTLGKAAPLPHTPGPWHVKRSTYGGYTILAETTRPADAGMPWMVARTVSDEPEDEANVRLIACAPELLAVLKHLLQMIANGAPESVAVNSVRQACAVVAQAEGR